jgi:hypothetical protein
MYPKVKTTTLGENKTKYTTRLLHRSRRALYRRASTHDNKNVTNNRFTGVRARTWRPPNVIALAATPDLHDKDTLQLQLQQLRQTHGQKVRSSLA